jgi:16S rRNA (uracil1498-N3)-methyltransferase
MHLFYHPELHNELVTVSQEESRHIGVLRLKPGESLFVTDGNGLLCKALVADSNSKSFQLQIMERYEHYNLQNYFLHVAIAPTKQMERFEWFLEKATEIGISEITPLICRHSERREVKTDRLNKILQSAMKQSLKAYLPVLNEPVSFQEIINREFQGRKFIANAASGKENNLPTLLQKKDAILVLVGPEGDFDDEELNLAGKNNFQSVNLGNSRLRTETAGLVVCAVAAIVNQ